MKSSDQRGEHERKPYRVPKLTVYGDLREITQTSILGGTVMDKIIMGGGKSR